jgi:hypothetical protein
MLLEIPLADAALRSGLHQEFVQRSHSIETRARDTLSCSPRDSFAWLLLFGLENQNGHLEEHTFDLLSMSHETSPYEAWIAVRRIVLAVPVVLAMPEALRQQILIEFQNLVRQGFVEMPVRVYFNATPAVRSLLQTCLDQLDAKENAAFAEALSKLRS